MSRWRLWLPLCCLFTAAQADEGAWANSLSHGSVLGFPSYEEANTLLRGWLQAHPDLLREERIGHSYLDRPILAYVLGKSTAQRSTRPKVLMTSLMHAREPASLTVLLYFLGHLLELSAQQDPKALYVLENREVWLVPFVNPDGYIYNQKLRRKVIRKNRRPTCKHGEGGGVDLNRNFGFHWSKQFSLCNEEYQGSEPFSEPETQAIKKICEEKHFVTAVNFHSFGGMLTHPYNWAREPRLPADDQHIYDEIAKIFGWEKFGPAIKTVGYTAPGESDDWMYNAHKIISMSPEVGPESGDFWPPAYEIPGINRRNFVRTMYVVMKAGLELSVDWRHTPVLSDQLPPNATRLAGGLPTAELELTLGNRGLASSDGSALGIALLLSSSAATEAIAPAPVLPALLQEAEAGAGTGTGTVPVTLLSSRAEAPMPAMLTFHLQPLVRRSSRRFRLLLGRALQGSSDVHGLQLCAAELRPGQEQGQGQGQTLCHCSGPNAGNQHNTHNGDSTAHPVSLVLAASSSSASSARAPAEAELCRAAAEQAQALSLASATSPSPSPSPSLPSSPSPATVTLQPAAGGSGTAESAATQAQQAQQAQTQAASMPPTAAPAPAPVATTETIAASQLPPAVLEPAFEAASNGETSASLALAAFVFTAAALGACLGWQAIFGRRMGPAPTIAYRRPQAPPLSPMERERASGSTKVAAGGKAGSTSFDEESAGAAAKV